MRIVAGAFAIALAWLGPEPAMARDPEPVIGPATVIDGDTIEVQSERIRLWGIDAPETVQTCTAEDEEWACGELAARALDESIGDRTVACAGLYWDPFDRMIAICRVDTEDMGAWLVRKGWALDWPRYSGGYYEHLEHEAERDGTGMWRGDFELPWAWRRDN